MEIILDLIKADPLYPIWWLFLSWIIWLLLRWRNLSRPSVSIMLLYSTSIIIFFIKTWQGLNACIELCYFDFSVFPFLAEVSFWFVVLYVPVSLALKPKFIFDRRKKWWISLLVTGLAIWHILSEESLSRISDYIYFDLFTTDIFFYTALGIFVPWFIWWLLTKIERPRPSVAIMILYSISAINTSTRLWPAIYVCKFFRDVCDVDFSLPLFLLEVAIWFIPLYALMKLISRAEFGNTNIELVEKRKGQSIGTE